MLAVKELSFKIGQFLLKDINLNIDKNEYFVLLGRSGSGKTTLIKCISGLYRITNGMISLHGKNITNILPEYRNISYLPQDYALFPHLNVYDNIIFGITARKKVTAHKVGGREVNPPPPAGDYHTFFKQIGKKRKINEITTRFEHIVSLLSIENLLKRDVNNLSGGEKQKVALARALIVHPDVLLLDEPFSSIDHGLKVELWFEIKEILKKLNIIVIHITHNLDEAHAIADKIAVLIKGRIEQSGTREEIFLKPRTEQVALYQGIKNIYSGIVTNINNEKIKIEDGKFRIIAIKEKQFNSGQKVKFCIRPQDIKIIKEGLPIREELKDNLFEGEIVSSLFYNDFCTIKLKSIVDFELRFPVYIYQRYNFYNGKRINIGIWQPGINIFQE